ncbi:unnamed protein product [Hapterophycus canaliculatus]
MEEVEPEVPAPTPTTETPATATAEPVSAPTSPPTPAGTDPGDDDAAVLAYEALGCFSDTSAGRVMRYKLNDPDLTTESCALECEGYAFFGTQYSYECWCGGNDTNHVQHGESESCDAECAGDATQICGGNWSMSVYQYTPTAPAETAEPFGNDDTVVASCDGVFSTLGYYCW